MLLSNRNWIQIFTLKETIIYHISEGHVQGWKCSPSLACCGSSVQHTLSSPLRRSFSASCSVCRTVRTDIMWMRSWLISGQRLWTEAWGCCFCSSLWSLNKILKHYGQYMTKLTGVAKLDIKPKYNSKTKKLYSQSKKIYGNKNRAKRDNCWL